MNFKEDIIFLLESYEKSYEKILTKLNEYDVEGLDNLIIVYYEKFIPNE